MVNIAIVIVVMCLLTIRICKKCDDHLTTLGQCERVISGTVCIKDALSVETGSMSELTRSGSTAGSGILFLGRIMNVATIVSLCEHCTTAVSATV